MVIHFIKIYAIVLASILIYNVTSYGQNVNKRGQFFPKVELKAQNIPKKDNLWVFILAGQSNMSGRGLVEPQDTIPSKRILTINKNDEIIVAKEPVHFYEPTVKGLDCGLSFSKTMIQHLPDSISILLIPTAIGGSKISEWLNDSIHRNISLLTNFKEKVELGKKYGQVKGILWHQGESDAHPVNIPLHSKRLCDLFEKFREVVGNKNLPVLIGELGSYSKSNGNWIKINKQINSYVRTDKNSLVIKTADLSDRGDKVHFNSEGQRTMGKRFAKRYIKKFM